MLLTFDMFQKSPLKVVGRSKALYHPRHYTMQERWHLVCLSTVSPLYYGNDAICGMIGYEFLLQ